MKNIFFMLCVMIDIFYCSNFLVGEAATINSEIPNAMSSPSSVEHVAQRYGFLYLLFKEASGTDRVTVRYDLKVYDPFTKAVKILGEVVLPDKINFLIPPLSSMPKGKFFTGSIDRNQKN